MNVEDIRKIIANGESINVEFKESKTELNKDVYQSVGGMLNRLGGHLLLGVKDDKTIVGVDKDCVEKIKKNFVTSINNPIKSVRLFILSWKSLRLTVLLFFMRLYLTLQTCIAFREEFMTETKMATWILRTIQILSRRCITAKQVCIQKPRFFRMLI